ncbi:MAG: choice-of-anchor D domain-containing protein, partial [Akkermansiaceae bacterium]|nr:choice-of-anchor D domain-containing protein [Akkermansiaceae bacterium]
MIPSIPTIIASVAILASGLLTYLSPSVQAAEIQVLYNTTEIVDGDGTPAVADGTFFGVQTVGAGNLSQTFTIKNLSTTAGDNLNLTGTPKAVIGGANPEDFVLTTQPAASVAPGASTTVVITWTPTFGGIHNATLSISNNDANENPYNFAIQATAQLKLTYTAGANGTLTGTTPQVVFSTATGSAVTAVPATGYHFVNWSDFSALNPRADTPVTANVTATANFAPGGYTLAYTAGANGSITGTTPQTVVHAASGTAVTAVPATGYSFVNWSDGSTANPRTDTNVMRGVNVFANFAIKTFTLTYAAGANGSLNGTTPQTVNYTTSGTAVTAVPATGYSFVNWSDGVLTAARTDS